MASKIEIGRSSRAAEYLLRVNQGEITLLDVLFEGRVDIGLQVKLVSNVVMDVQVQVLFDQVLFVAERPVLWQLFNCPLNEARPKGRKQPLAIRF